MKHLCIILFVLPLICFGQGWEVVYVCDNIDVGSSVQQTTDGGYIIVGQSLFKTDENGNQMWCNNDIKGYSVQQTFDGGYIIGGWYLLKTDENGEEQWSQTYNDSIENKIFNSVQQTTDGGYILTGFINETGNYYDMWLLKTDENGEEQWSQTFGGDYNDYGFSVQQTTDGGYITIGYTSSFGNGQTDVYLLKTDENGEEQWSQTFGGDYSDWGFSVQQTIDGGYIISGHYSLGVSSDSRRSYLLKTDGDGNEEWSQTFGGIQTSGSRSVQQTFDGGYIITGWMLVDTILGLNTDLYSQKTDGNGNEEWFQTFGGSGGDYGYSVQQTFDGGYIISGIYGYGDNGMGYLIKTDSEGNITTTSTIEIPTPTSKRELLKTTNILGQENTTIKNQPMIEIYDDGSTEKKIVIE